LSAAEAALNAFVQAPNSKRLKFCLHFCNQVSKERTNERTNETKKGRNTPWFGVATQRSLVEHDHLPRQARDRQNETRPNQKKALVAFSSFLLFFFSSVSGLG
jgi:hypothetical protein